ncbi:MAG: GNAT family N-acetyltransferase [Limnochordia bacterium]|jgi:ribosomal protein S18 acetylase RimI-like enzyme
MLIRHYREDDSVAIARITAAAWPEVSIAAMREQRYGVLGNTPWAEQKAHAILARFRAHPEWTVIAEIDGQVVGYASYTIALQGDLGVVGDNAVDPEWQGRGIGAALIRTVIQRLIDAGVRALEVSAFSHNAAARRVYERCGFKEMAVSVHYTLRPEDCIFS